MKSFSGQRVIVTGGSSGIGLALCQQLYQHGAVVWMIGRDPERLESAKYMILEEDSQVSDRLHTVSLDVTNQSAVEDKINRIQKKHGSIDVLLNSAGAAHPGYVEELDFSIFHWLMDVNYFGTVNCVKAVLPGMLLSGTGTIVNIASMAGIIGIFGYTAYAPTKFAVRGFSDALRAEMKPRGIHVSIVYPPDTDTPQLAYENQYKPPETKALAKHGGLLSAGEVAQTILEGITRRRYVILPGLESKLLYLASGVLRPLINPIQDLIISRNSNKEK